MRIIHGRQGWLSWLCVLAVLVPSAGCRSGMGWPRIPGMGWLSSRDDYGDNGWASYEGSDELTPPVTGPGTPDPTLPEKSQLADRGAGSQQAPYDAGRWTYPSTQTPEAFPGLENAQGNTNTSGTMASFQRGGAGATAPAGAAGPSSSSPVQIGFYDEPAAPSGSPNQAFAGNPTGPSPQGTNWDNAAPGSASTVELPSTNSFASSAANRSPSPAPGTNPLHIDFSQDEHAVRQDQTAGTTAAGTTAPDFGPLPPPPGPNSASSMAATGNPSESGPSVNFPSEEPAERVARNVRPYQAPATAGTAGGPQTYENPYAMPDTPPAGGNLAAPAARPTAPSATPGPTTPSAQPWRPGSTGTYRTMDPGPASSGPGSAGASSQEAPRQGFPAAGGVSSVSRGTMILAVDEAFPQTTWR